MKLIMQRLRYAFRHPMARVGLWACAPAIAMAITSACLWWPSLRAHQEITEDVAMKRRLLIQLRQNEALMQLYEGAKVDVKALEGKLSGAAAQADIVGSFAQLARKHEVRITSQAYEESRGRATPAALIGEFVIQGKYDAIRGFLSELPSLPMLCDIQEASLERTSEPSMLKSQLRIAMYRRIMETSGERL